MASTAKEITPCTHMLIRSSDGTESDTNDEPTRDKTAANASIATAAT